MKIADYIKYDGLGLAELIKQKEITAQELLETAIKLKELINPTINAIVHTFYDKAQQQIKASSAAGLFQGVPFLLKDLGFAYQDTIESYGSHYFATNKVNYTSDFVKRLLDSGFIIFGRTNSAELGLSYTTEPTLFGPTRNPWALAHTPGGSSGGAAAAVAARIVPIAAANDGGGSIRVPAACCGLFGLKPSRGSMPCGPKAAELWSGLATPHVITRTIRDSAAVLDKMLINEFKRFSASTLNLLQAHQTPPQKLKIALLNGAFAPVPVEPECQHALAHACKLLQNLGHTVETVEIKLDLEKIGNAVIKIIAAHTKTDLDWYRSLIKKDYQANEIEPITMHFAKLGENISASDLITARHIIHQETRPILELMTQYDILLTPALAKLPILLGELNSYDEFDYFNQKNVEFSPFTSLFNHTGQPAMTVPVYWTEKGLPVSVQFAAAYGDELTLLRLAAQIEQVQPWGDRLPGILTEII